MYSTQLDLFSAVLHAYAKPEQGALSNKELYNAVADSLDIEIDDSSNVSPIGEEGKSHNTIKRKIRWYQQTLKQAGILEREPDARGIWRLTQPSDSELSSLKAGVSVVGFSTELGIAIIGACDSVFSKIDSPITLVVTSPPYPLASARKYGNPTEPQYVDWICKQLEPIVKLLVPGGSICLNVSNDIFLPKSPARSMYRERLVLALHDRLGLWKMDELIWENPNKPPGPIRYASIDRTQLNVGYEPVYWFTNDPSKVKSDNREVLQEHSERHLALIKGGGESREASYSDGAYRIKKGSFSAPTKGRIPRNILRFSHNCATQMAYKKAARALGLPVHGAPMPQRLAEFLIKFLSKPEELVVDPFGGSFTTASAAQRLGRRWISTDCMLEYVWGGSTRFTEEPGYKLHVPVSARPEIIRNSLELNF